MHRDSGPYSVTIIGTDGSGASTTQTFTWTVTNPTPTATDDALSGTENASLSGNVITDDNGSGVDSDPDGDALTVGLVNGLLANVGSNVTGTERRNIQHRFRRLVHLQSWQRL